MLLCRAHPIIAFNWSIVKLQNPTLAHYYYDESIDNFLSVLSASTTILLKTWYNIMTSIYKMQAHIIINISNTTHINLHSSSAPDQADSCIFIQSLILLFVVQTISHHISFPPETYNNAIFRDHQTFLDQSPEFFSYSQSPSLSAVMSCLSAAAGGFFSYDVAREMKLLTTGYEWMKESESNSECIQS